MGTGELQAARAALAVVLVGGSALAFPPHPQEFDKKVVKRRVQRKRRGGEYFKDQGESATRKLARSKKSCFRLSQQDRQREREREREEERERFFL